MNRFVEKVTELSLSLDITGWDALPREVNFGLLWVWAVPHSWTGRSQQDALCLQDFPGTAAITLPRGQSWAKQEGCSQ